MPLTQKQDHGDGGGNGPPISSLKVKDLRAIASAQGIPYYTSLTKSELVAELEKGAGAPPTIRARVGAACVALLLVIAIFAAGALIDWGYTNMMDSRWEALDIAKHREFVGRVCGIWYLLGFLIVVYNLLFPTGLGSVAIAELTQRIQSTPPAAEGEEAPRTTGGEPNGGGQAKPDPREALAFRLPAIGTSIPRHQAPKRATTSLRQRGACGVPTSFGTLHRLTRRAAIAKNAARPAMVLLRRDHPPFCNTTTSRADAAAPRGAHQPACTILQCARAGLPAQLVPVSSASAGDAHDDTQGHLLSPALARATARVAQLEDMVEFLQIEREYTRRTPPRSGDAAPDPTVTARALQVLHEAHESLQSRSPTPQASDRCEPMVGSTASDTSTETDKHEHEREHTVDPQLAGAVGEMGRGLARLMQAAQPLLHQEGGPAGAEGTLALSDCLGDCERLQAGMTSALAAAAAAAGLDRSIAGGGGAIELMSGVSELQRQVWCALAALVSSQREAAHRARSRVASLESQVQRAHDDRLVQEASCRELQHANGALAAELFCTNGRIWRLARIRPTLQSAEAEPASGLHIDKPARAVRARGRALSTNAWPYHFVFGSAASNRELFHVASAMVTATCSGIDALIAVDGPSGAGKSHTIFSRPDSIANLTARQIFRLLAGQAVVSCSLIEIYEDKIYDLLHERQKLHCAIVEARSTLKPQLGSSAAEEAVADEASFTELLARGLESRVRRAMPGNDGSSRGHVLLTLNIADPTCARTSQLSLLDLAGRERLASDATPSQADAEHRAITSSLSAFHRILRELPTAVDAPHTRSGSYVCGSRDLNLTKCLFNCFHLGSQTRILLINCLSPEPSSLDLNIATLDDGQIPHHDVASPHTARASAGAAR